MRIPASLALSGRPLEIILIAGNPASGGKDPKMWVFDGEEWTNDAADAKRQPESPQQLPGEFYPELQVIEIVPVPTRTDIRHIPQPYPIP